jgi:DNA-binding response OmpR family regulator
VCRTLRREGNWTPILMLTAKDGVWDEVEGLDTGADDYLAKPFSYAVLLARLRALRRRSARPRPTVLEAGELRLDPATRRVWLRGEQIDLTRREFSILEYFLHHPDEVLAKRDILDHVWDFDFDGDPNIVGGLRAATAHEAAPVWGFAGNRNDSGSRIPACRSW